MESQWKNFDLSGVHSKIQELEKFLTCKKCDNIFPEGEECFVLPLCRCQLCKKCYDPKRWSGSCPACGAKANRKDIHADKSRIEFLRGLNNLKRNFGGLSITNDQVTKNDLIPEKKSAPKEQSILKEKSITTEKSIIFDEDEDLDIDLNDGQVDMNSFGDVGRIKQPEEKKQPINDEDGDEKENEFIPPTLQPPPKIRKKSVGDEKENEFIPPTLQPPPKIRKKSGAPSKKAPQQAQKKSKNESSKAPQTQTKSKKETTKAPQTQTKSKNEFKTYTEAQLKKKNIKGETPLHAACNKRNEKLVQHLIGQGASPNTQDHNGLTPLHEVAAYTNSISIVKLLLDSGEVFEITILSLLSVS